MFTEFLLKKDFYVDKLLAAKQWPSTGLMKKGSLLYIQRYAKNCTDN
jgi:hypothetical protein